MKDLFEAIGNLLLEFTWRRFIGFALIIILLLVSLLAYEKYTNSLQLGRIERSAAILKQLQEIESKNLKDPILKKLQADITTELAAASKPLRVNLQLPQVMDNFRAPEAKWKFLAGGALWWLFSLIAAVQIHKKSDNNAPEAFAGMVPTGFICGLIGVIFPTYEEPVLNFLVYPLASFIVSLSIIGVFAYATEFRKKMREIKAEKEKQKEQGHAEPASSNFNAEPDA